MVEFKLQCDYLRKKKMKFFNDQRSKEYHGFLVINLESIPNEYVFSAGKNSGTRWIWISHDLVKRVGIDFGNPSFNPKEFKFIVNLGEEKSAKFTTNNRNWMVLKDKTYFENTIKKIAFWDSEDYFYEENKLSNLEKARPPKSNSNDNKLNLAIGLGIIYIAIVISFICVILIMNKRAKKKPEKPTRK